MGRKTMKKTQGLSQSSKRFAGFLHWALVPVALVALFLISAPCATMGQDISRTIDDGVSPDADQPNEIDTELSEDEENAVAPDADQTDDIGAPGTVGYDPGAESRASAAPEGVPSLWFTVDVQGDYIAKGVGMRNRGFGQITIAGIPAGATIKYAFLYWTILGSSELTNFKNGSINGTPITGLLVGSGTDPCWSAGTGFSYWANITSVVVAKRNGAYSLAGFASGRVDGADPWLVGSPAPMAEGASMVVIFEKASIPAYPLTRIQIFDGYAVTSAATLSISPNWGFAASNPVPLVRTTFIGADGQIDKEPGSKFNGVTITPPSWDGTDTQPPFAKFSKGNLWDTATVSVGKYVKPGNLGATITTTGGPDCIAWTAQVLSIGHNGAADSDGDKLLDGWEANGYDADGDGTVDVDLPKHGASPFKKDLFVEMDYMGDSYLPLAADLNRIKSVFSSSPYANNPNGTTGISIHLDAGAARGTAFNLGGGNLVPFDDDLNPVLTQYNAIKAANFNAKRAKIFYYMIWAHGYDGGTSSGNAFAIPNDSFLVTLGKWNAEHGTPDQKVGTFIHEFGHDLGLGHGGNESKNYKPNYLSIMTYAFQVTGVPKTGTLAPDFGYSRSLLPNLIEGSLNESVGLNSTLANSYRTKWYCPSGALTTSPGKANGPLDWNCNGVISSPVAVDLNHDGVQNTLTGFKDWGNLTFGGGAVGAGIEQGVEEAPVVPSVLEELTLEEHLRDSR
jgi:hypothetical protein